MKRGKFFSRPDGTYLKKIDPFMRFFPFIMKGRNEAAVYFKQQIDVTDLKAWLTERNRQAAASGSGPKATVFHAILAAMARTMHERPQVNRFIMGRRVYQRHELAVAFVFKREFSDNSNEEIALLKFSADETMTSISEKIQDEVRRVRQEAKLNAEQRHGIVNWFNYLMSTPRILLRGAVRFLAWLDYHGWLPRFIIELDPMHSSIFVSNLGSLGIDAPYHHLYEWGTTSIFMTIGVSEKKPVFAPDGSITGREFLNIAFTADERICDGFYFARSLQRFRQYLERPAELDKPAKVPDNK